MFRDRSSTGDGAPELGRGGGPGGCPRSVTTNLGDVGKFDFEINSVGVEEITVVDLGDPKIERSIGKDPGGGLKFQSESGEVPSPHDENQKNQQ